MKRNFLVFTVYQIHLQNSQDLVGLSPQIFSEQRPLPTFFVNPALRISAERFSQHPKISKNSAEPGCGWAVYRQRLSRRRSATTENADRKIVDFEVGSATESPSKLNTKLVIRTTLHSGSIHVMFPCSHQESADVTRVKLDSFFVDIIGLHTS